MLVLGIDTSTKVGSVALYHSEQGLLAEVLMNVKTNHSGTIMKAIDYVMELANTRIDDLDKVAVTVGPGSFTGIRIGVAIGKALVFRKNIELVGVNTLDLLAHGVQRAEFVIPLIDARKGRAYYSLYQNKEGIMTKLDGYKDGEISEFLDEYKEKVITFTGDGSYIYRETIEKIMGTNADFLYKGDSLPKATILAEMAVDMEGVNPILLEPYYHSKTQAEREKESKKSL